MTDRVFFIVLGGRGLGQGSSYHVERTLYQQVSGLWCLSLLLSKEFLDLGPGPSFLLLSRSNVARKDR